jgi:hypothetical protein
MVRTHLHLLDLLAPGRDASAASREAVGQEAPSMMRFAAPTWGSTTAGKARFDHVGVLPQGEPKAP